MTCYITIVLTSKTFITLLLSFNEKMFINCTDCETQIIGKQIAVALCKDHLLIETLLGPKAFFFSGTDGHATRWSFYQLLQLQHARNITNGREMLYKISPNPKSCQRCMIGHSQGEVIQLCDEHSTISEFLGEKAVAFWSGEFPTWGDEYQHMQLLHARKLKKKDETLV